MFFAPPLFACGLHLLFCAALLSPGYESVIRQSVKEANLSPLNKKSIYVIFPIYIGDEKHEYTFKFVIDKIVVTKD